MFKGFTLIELSIGLVISGLFVGSGFLAQSIVEAAKIEKVAHKILQYEAATMAYKNKYGTYPGDENADGVLDSAEMKGFWTALEKDGMVKFDKEIYAQVAAEGEKEITARKASANGNLAFEIILSPKFTQLLEKKMSVRPIAPSEQSVGLYNPNGEGKCKAADGKILTCEKAQELQYSYGELLYYIEGN